VGLAYANLEGEDDTQYPPDWGWWPIDVDPFDEIYPPGWPITVNPGPSSVTPDDYYLDVTLGTIYIGEAVTLTADILDGDDLDTDELNGHILKVTATLDGATLQLKKDAGDDFANQIYYQASNYTGAKYGVTDTVIFDLDADDGSGAVAITVEIITTTDGFNGTDSVDVTAPVFVWTTSPSSVQRDVVFEFAVEVQNGNGTTITDAAPEATLALNDADESDYLYDVTIETGDWSSGSYTDSVALITGGSGAEAAASITASATGYTDGSTTTFDISDYYVLAYVASHAQESQSVLFPGPDDGTYLYAKGGTIPEMLHKLQKSDMNIVDTAPGVGSSSTGSGVRSVALYGSNAFVASRYFEDPYYVTAIYRVNTSTMSYDQAVSPDQTIGGVDYYGMFEAGGTIYALHGEGKILAVNPSTLATAFASIASISSGRDMVYDGSGNIYVLGYSGAYWSVVKVALSTLTQTGITSYSGQTHGVALALSNGYVFSMSKYLGGVAYDIVVYDQSDMSYVATMSSPSAHTREGLCAYGNNVFALGDLEIVQYDAVSLEMVASLTLSGDPVRSTQGGMIADSTHVYFPALTLGDSRITIAKVSYASV